jgi:hypothetical protein
VAETAPRRLLLPDVRGNNQYLRATWHEDTSVVVVSHWVGDVCVASTPVALADAAQLIGLLAGALEQTAAAAEAGLPSASPSARQSAVS